MRRGRGGKLRRRVGGRGDDAGQVLLQVGGAALESTDEFLLAAFVGDQDGGGVEAARGMLQFAAQGGRDLIDGAVHTGLVASGDEDGRAARGQTGHRERSGAGSTEQRGGRRSNLIARMIQGYLNKAQGRFGKRLVLAVDEGEAADHGFGA